MANIYNNGLVSGVGSAMTRQAIREAYVELPTDQDGNCTTRHSPTERKFFKGYFIGSFIFLLLYYYQQNMCHMIRFI
ncbi:hypothetical protein KQI77_05640 [Clostridium sp. MSJ-8]|uniref:hypothetical protein n=1 Tax=Clostridium sp. MSJ-8 TaxID=2841510 RepID=UPI001C0EA2FD|nr:hypothetical protein [Clostridium sp. MSJ-8]MBU5487647.1 hypothetical protein [Clostridium sp. MSJ-8]